MMNDQNRRGPDSAAVDRFIRRVQAADLLPAVARQIKAKQQSTGRIDPTDVHTLVTMLHDAGRISSEAHFFALAVFGDANDRVKIDEAFQDDPKGTLERLERGAKETAPIAVECVAELRRIFLAEGIID